MAKKKSAPEVSPQGSQGTRAIHIYAEESGALRLELGGKWSYMDLLDALNYEAEWVRIQLIQKTVEQRMGYTQQMQEVLDMVKAGRGDEPSQE